MFPTVPFPTMQPDTHDMPLPNESFKRTKPYVYTDLDWAGDIKTRNSISGVALILGGGVVVYKTIVQKSIALSSTEAEFYALSEAGKICLYFRSILDDLKLA